MLARRDGQRRRGVGRPDFGEHRRGVFVEADAGRFPGIGDGRSDAVRQRREGDGVLRSEARGRGLAGAGAGVENVDPEQARRSAGGGLGDHHGRVGRRQFAADLGRLRDLVIDADGPDRNVGAARLALDQGEAEMLRAEGVDGRRRGLEEPVRRNDAFGRDVGAEGRPFLVGRRPRGKREQHRGEDGGESSKRCRHKVTPPGARG